MMGSDNDQVFGNSIESSEENAELKTPGNGKEAGCEVFCCTRSDEGEKENNGNMSGHHSSGFMIDPKNEGIREDRDSVVDPPVFYMHKNVMDMDGSKAGCENSPLRDVVATSRSVALTLGDIISMEDSHISPSNNNDFINGPEENVDNESEPEKTEEPNADNLTYLSSDMLEIENQRQNNLFSNGFGKRSFSEAESGLAHITYSGPISVCGSLSVRSDGSTLAIGMEQQSCKNGESWEDTTSKGEGVETLLSSSLL